MERSAIEKIVELGAPNIITENGYVYSDKKLEVIRTPLVATMFFRTLRGLVDTLKHEHEDFLSPLIVNVAASGKVDVYTAIGGEDRAREIPYQAEAEIPSIEFGRDISYEQMMITLKSKFVETPELLEVIQLLGTITEQNNMQASDDGFSQTVVVRKGIALKDNKVVKPIVKLKPYRTFLEVDQPESEFLLRLHDGMRVALYEADGGTWKLQARSNISTYLQAELADLITQGALIVVE